MSEAEENYQEASEDFIEVRLASLRETCVTPVARPLTHSRTHALLLLLLHALRARSFDRKSLNPSMRRGRGRLGVPMPRRHQSPGLGFRPFRRAGRAGRRRW